MSDKITPELIPHKLFHTGKWLQPVERPDWYYFLKKRNLNTITNDKFIGSVDKPIRPLVRWLHKRGIKTTPSCSGHHIAERSLENIYEGLKKDAREIRKEGLKLKDIETGKEFAYRNQRYKLPWSRRDFLRKVSVYQQKGILGLHLPGRRKVKEEIEQLQVPGVSVQETGSVLLIFADNNSGDNRYAWKMLTKGLKKILAAG